MLKIFWVLVALLPTSIFASIITHSEVELTNANHILSMNNQQYSEKYQNIMLLTQIGELGKAKQALAYLLTQNPYDITALDISGNILLAEKKLPQAINAFQRVLSSKQSPEVMAKLGVSHLLSEDSEKARLWLTQSLSLSPNNALALRYLAWLENKALNKGSQLHYLNQLVKLSKNKKALYEYHVEYLTLLIDNNNVNDGLNFINNHQKQLLESADSIKSSIQLIEVELLIKASNLELAKEKFKQYPKPKFKNDEAINYSLLSVYYYASLKDYQKAESIIKTHLSNNNSVKSIAEYSLAKVHFDHGNYEAAHQKLMWLLDNEPQVFQKVNYLNDIVANYALQSRYSDAIKVVKVQIEKSPNVPQFQHQLAELYILSGRTKAGATQLNKVITHFPEYIPSYIVKARQLIKNKEDDAAIEFLNNATNKHPQAAELWLDYATFYVKKNQPKQALVILETAVNVNKNNPLLTFELAAMYDTQQLLEKSEPLYLKILQNYPEYLPALDNLATNYFTLNKDLTNATVLAKRAFMLAPNDPFIINLRAQAHIFEKEHQQAIDMLTPVIDKFEHSGLGYFTLAKAYKAENNTKLTEKNINKALNKVLPEILKKEALAIKAAL